jgi:hypothetical protein
LIVLLQTSFWWITIWCPSSNYYCNDLHKNMFHLLWYDAILFMYKWTQTNWFKFYNFVIDLQPSKCKYNPKMLT